MEKTKTSEPRITYVQKALQELIEKRELMSWCKERNLPRTTVYYVATGDELPPYALICKMLPYFSPAEWVYFTDEEIPYEHKTLPALDPKAFSVFLKKHKLDYKDIAKKLDMTEVRAKNVFLHRRANLTLFQIRKLASEVNPEEFFIEAENPVEFLFYPERGDIVSLSRKNILVLSTNKDNVANDCFIGTVLEEEKEGSLFIKGETTKGYISIQTLASFSYIRRNPVLIDHASQESLDAALKIFQKVFK
ncbi:MAG: hypothetical protein MJ185_02665 [Treponema sp.]|nr:hypothetical protein [Treponema sp.]